MLPRVFRRFIKKKAAVAIAKRHTTTPMTTPDNVSAEIELLGVELGLVLEIVGGDTG
jgi:hypothetical protein